MNIILLENENLKMFSVMGKLLKKFPQSSQITINKFNYYQAIETIAFRPILTESWLVRVSDRLQITQMEKILKHKENVNVITVRDSLKLETLKEKFISQGIPFKVVENKKISQQDLIIYVCESLPISYKDAVYLCKRHNMYAPMIVNSVNSLLLFDKVNRDIIKKYTKRYDSVNLTEIVDSMLGVSTRKKSKIIEKIYEFRYGLEFLLDFIINELNNYELVFRLIESGELNLDNYRDIKAEANSKKELKKLSSISDYRLYNMIESFSSVSIELLYLTKTSVELIKPRRDEIYKLILLLK